MRAKRLLRLYLFAAFALAMPMSAETSVLPTETRLYFSEPKDLDSLKKKGSPLIEVALLPDQLLVLESDIVNPETGKPVAKKGTQFIPQLVSNGIQNFCSHQHLRSNATTTKIMLCVVGDPEKEPVSSYFWTFGSPGFGPGAAGFPQDAVVQTTPITFTVAEPDKINRDYRLRFLWRGGDGVIQPILAEIEYCSRGYCSWRAATRIKFMPDPDTPPIEIFGHKLSCISAGKNIAKCSADPVGKRGYMSISFPGYPIGSIDLRLGYEE